MKTASEISIDFHRAKEKANELDEIARGMRNLANGNVGSTLQELSTAWKGEAANKYLTKGEMLKDKILNSAGDLEQTASTIRSIAQKTYDAEMAAYRIAQERTYGNH